ncbi:family A G protein-coupled receptor-like protein [Moesziomyces antarcticus]|uniref:Family A G protein-coupled receptor-like protein n=2 Tax=Pseudozyma antarctica TaxID=84753 RepID=A0A081CPB0_PSEA2|nr:family A G protein-coupled receptor-like protein [Moesziomyces antarcticus]GAK68506.1 family A G protein-coupled receptor-like protein [Moesziomyces antarcticus]SPO47212.1 related to YRO2 - strong similarity to HSP30 heat shock protein Yro1p [Moesziomyces antarcticus]
MWNSLQKRAGNRALRTNPPNADIHLGRWGSDWGYVMFCVMAASLIGLLIWSTKLARNRRTFHYLFIPVLAISSVAWYSMASDLGATPVPVQFRHNSPLGPGSRYPTRQIWFARYIDWTLTTSLLLLSLLLITGLPLSVIFITLFFNILMIVCGLLGALTPTRYKWAYFVFACAALGYVLYHVFASGLRSARRLGGGFGRAYLTCASLLAVIWPMYAICWGLSEGGNVIGVSEEFIFYGLLDIVSKPLFAFLLLAMLRDCDYGALRLRSGKITESRIEASERDRDNAHESGQSEQAKALEGPTQPGAESGLAPADNQYSASQHRPLSHTSTRPEPTGVPQTMMTPVHATATA